MTHFSAYQECNLTGKDLTFMKFTETPQKQNLEIKVRLDNRDRLRDLIKRKKGNTLQELNQIDTYFQVPRGRLKFREIAGSSCELIAYQRADEKKVRPSTYTIVPECSPLLKDVLSESLGTLAVVKKNRLLFLWNNIRVHLDRVDGLGDFLELEGVLSDSQTTEKTEKRMTQLMTAFEIGPEAIEPKSYLDLIQTPFPAEIETESTQTLTAQYYEIYTDGGCHGNPGPGGYGAIIVTPQGIEELSGYEPHTTNNRMELTAALKALEKTSPKSRIVLTTDSNYLVKGMTEWLPGWKKNNWKNSQNKAVVNQDLWEQLDTLVRHRSVEWKWVKGHSGHPENERCDELANIAILNKGR